jgi:methanogenic corrinoid protein MtbC1
LSDYATTPLYNIKAVVQATGISPSTLRAWERRYNMCRPCRSASGYRLYAERDVAVIRWLKAQVDTGMSISQAVSWLDTLAQEAGGMEHVRLPGGTGRDPLAASLAGYLEDTTTRREPVRDFAALQSDLLHALLAYDEETAALVIAEAFAIYPVEQIGERLFQPVLTEIGKRWQCGALQAAAEHFATNYLRQWLTGLLHALPTPSHGPLIWVACAPTELHEIGALLLATYLRRAGYRVHYLGQSLPAEGFATEVQRQQPALVLFSATTTTAAEELAQLTARLTPNGLNGHAYPVIGYGGQIFSRRPDLCCAITGVYLGENAHTAVQAVDQLLCERAAQQSRDRQELIPQ